MTTRGDVEAAIERIKAAGGSGQALRIAELQLMMPLSSAACDRVLARLQAAFPAQFAPDGAGATGVGPAGRGPVDLAPPAGPGPTDPAPPTGPGLTDPKPPDPGPPGPARGAGAEAMQHAERQLAQQLSTTAEFDRRIVEAVLAATQRTAAGRERLDDLEAQIAGAARSWDLTTALGAREFQRFLIGRLTEITRVVADVDGDDTAKRALAAALALLYQPERAGADDGTAPVDRPAGPPTRSGPDPAAVPAEFIDWPDEPDPIDDTPVPPAPPVAPGPAPAPPVAPTLPAVGGAPGGAPALPAMGGALPLGALSGLLHRPTPTGPADSAPDVDPEPAMEPADAPADPTDLADPDRAAAANTTVHLPDGKTITVATPQLAAVLQAAADGTPIAEAFHRHGITIPAPGTPVTAPVDPSALAVGDIGIFTDRHALAIGDARALLDGQIQRVGNIRGPGFLGWQHPPMLTVPAPPERPPAPTRPVAVADA